MPHQVSPKSELNVFAKIAIIVVASFLGYIAFEVSFRLYIQLKYLGGNYPVIVYTETEARESPGYPGIPDMLESELQKPDPFIGHFKQNQDIFLWFYDDQHRLSQKIKFHTNNLGFLSRKNYTLPRKEHEYRIAILGDSMTGLPPPIPLGWTELRVY